MASSDLSCSDESSLEPIDNLWALQPSIDYSGGASKLNYNEQHPSVTGGLSSVHSHRAAMDRYLSEDTLSWTHHSPTESKSSRSAILHSSFLKDHTSVHDAKPDHVGIRRQGGFACLEMAAHRFFTWLDSLHDSLLVERIKDCLAWLYDFAKHPPYQSPENALSRGFRLGLTYLEFHRTLELDASHPKLRESTPGISDKDNTCIDEFFAFTPPRSPISGPLCSSGPSNNLEESPTLVGSSSDCRTDSAEPVEYSKPRRIVTGSECGRSSISVDTTLALGSQTLKSRRSHPSKLMACIIQKHNAMHGLPNPCNFVGNVNMSSITYHLKCSRHKDIISYIKLCHFCSDYVTDQNEFEAFHKTKLCLQGENKTRKQNRGLDCVKQWKELYRRIYPNGDEIPCPFVEHNAGNIRHESEIAPEEREVGAWNSGIDFNDLQHAPLASGRQPEILPSFDSFQPSEPSSQALALDWSSDLNISPDPLLFNHFHLSGPDFELDKMTDPSKNSKFSEQQWVPPSIEHTFTDDASSFGLQQMNSWHHDQFSSGTSTAQQISLNEHDDTSGQGNHNWNPGTCPIQKPHLEYPNLVIDGNNCTKEDIAVAEVCIEAIAQELRTISPTSAPLPELFLNTLLNRVLEKVPALISAMRSQNELSQTDPHASRTNTTRIPPRYSDLPIDSAQEPQGIFRNDPYLENWDTSTIDPSIIMRPSCSDVCGSDLSL